MIRVALTALLLLVITASARADPFWLVIIASDPSPTAMARQARNLSARYPGGFLLQTSDCGHADTVFAWVTEVRRSAEAAEATIARWPALWGDAYVLRCDVRPRSLLFWGMSAVDESVADLPESQANASDLDWGSAAYPLPDDRTILVIRSFDRHGKGRRAGRRERVLLGPAFADPLLLEEDCADAGGFATQDGLVAFHCAREVVAGRPLHAVAVFDRHGKRRAEFARCRDPYWSGDHVLVCREEAFTPEGDLQLRTKRIALTPGIIPPTKVERLWLPVGATNSSPAEIARRAKSLSRDFPGGLVVQMSDCAGPENLFAWVAEPAYSKAAAEATLARLRFKAPEARLEPCDARAGTLLAFRVGAVDASIAEIPDQAMEFWSEGDRVSSAQPLPDGRTILLVRYYESADESDLPGMAERVLLTTADGGLTILDAYCSEAGGFVARHGLVAFHCGEQVLNHMLLHAVHVVDGTGKRLAHIAFCRDPDISADNIIACKAEIVSSEGELTLRTKRIALNADVTPAVTVERRWLVIVASDSSPVEIARKVWLHGGLVIRTRDCGDAEDQFVLAQTVTDWEDAAQAELGMGRETAKDAYVRPCEVRSGTLPALNVDAVDRSIAKLPEIASGSEKLDLVSSAHPLPDGRTIVVERSLAPDADGLPPRLRESVSLDALDGPRPVPLLDHCMEPGGFAGQGDRVAFHCSRESGADYVLHDLFVFDERGRQLAAIERCRDPMFTSDGIVCQAEFVRPDGVLELQRKFMLLPK